MSITVVNTATTAEAGASTSHAITVPSGVAAGDLLVMLVQKFGNSSPTWGTPSGWTKQDEVAVSTIGRAAIYYKVATTSEDAGDTVTVSSVSSVACNIGLIAFRGVDNSTPFVGEVSAADGANTTSHTVNAAAVSPTGNAVAVFVLSFYNTGSTFTPPTGYTEDIETSSGGGASALMDFSHKLVTSGALGSLTTTSTGSARGISFALAFNEAAPAVPTTGLLWPRGWKTGGGPTTGQLFPRRVIT